MAITDPHDTLAYHQSRPLTSHRDMRQVPLASVTKAAVRFFQNDGFPGTIPESEALWFYGMNHGMALLSTKYAALQPLSAPDLAYVQKYYAKMNDAALRAFYYLLIICTREARHNKSLAQNKPEMLKLFGGNTADWFMMSGGEGTIHQKLQSNPPVTTIGNFVECIRWQFYNSKWSGGFGGKAWGKVTDCLVRFVYGEFTAEMMLDTIWTLAHNNGPIFNKGHCYGMYGPHLVTILDVQRSGQIPEGILTDDVVSKYASPELRGIMKSLKEAFPGVLGEYVDWYKVEALGSVNKYPAQKEKQLLLHGASEMASEQEKAIAAKHAEEQAWAAKMSQLYDSPTFEIYPGLTVNKNLPARAA